MNKILMINRERELRSSAGGITLVASPFLVPRCGMILARTVILMY